MVHRISLPYADRMFLENLVIDAVDPLRLGRFWEAALGTTALTQPQDLYETRLVLTEGQDPSGTEFCVLPASGAGA